MKDTFVSGAFVTSPLVEPLAAWQPLQAAATRIAATARRPTTRGMTDPIRIACPLVRLEMTCGHCGPQLRSLAGRQWSVMGLRLRLRRQRRERSALVP